MSKILSLKNAKLIGGIGAIWYLVSSTASFLVPTFFLVPLFFSPVTILGQASPIVGLILILISLWELGKIIEDKSIFLNYLIGIALSFAALVFFISSIVFLFFSLIVFVTGYKTDIAQAIFFVLLCWAIFAVGNYFVMKSFKKAAKALQEEKFKIAGILQFVGAIFTPILVGFLVHFVGSIFVAVAFFSLPDQIKREVVK